jgi:hypothetical protein
MLYLYLLKAKINNLINPRNPNITLNKTIFPIITYLFYL